MTHRSYSVVVVPDEWEGSLEELATAMLPIIRREPKQVLPLLARGPMTLEADLSVEEAGLLQARLNKLGVPARVYDAAGETVSDSAHRGAKKTAEAPKKETQAPKRPKQKKAQKEKASAESQWSSLFPDMDSNEADENAASKPKASKPKAPKLNLPKPKSTKPKSGESASGKKLRSLDELAGDSKPAFGAEAAPEEPPELDNAPSKPAARHKPKSKPSPKPPEQPASPGLPGSKPETGASGPPTGGFDAGRMNDALHADDDRKPPYAPKGFDDSLEHIPALAGLLSLIAPGAGQVYNGQKEQARGYGLRAALVLPWYRSVRQASDYAEKIRTYWAPKPPSGALKDALKYLIVFWLVFGPLIAALGWAGTFVYDVASQPEAPKVTEVDVRDAFEQARTDMYMARIEGLDGVASHIDQRDSQHERFTMSDEERAQRLFRRGVGFCREGKYSTCESAMKRVSSLSSELRRHAYRLQAWASVRKQGGDDPMPDVGKFDSIEEYERRQEAGRQADEEASEGVDGEASQGAGEENEEAGEEQAPPELP